MVDPSSRTFLQRGSPTPTSLASVAWIDVKSSGCCMGPLLLFCRGLTGVAPPEGRRYRVNVLSQEQAEEVAEQFDGGIDNGLDDFGWQFCDQPGQFADEVEQRVDRTAQFPEEVGDHLLRCNVACGFRSVEAGQSLCGFVQFVAEGGCPSVIDEA